MYCLVEGYKRNDPTPKDGRVIATVAVLDFQLGGAITRMLKDADYVIVTEISDEVFQAFYQEDYKDYDTRKRRQPKDRQQKTGLHIVD